MVFYQFQEAGNKEFQSMKKRNSVVGIVATGANGTVAAKWGTMNFAMPYFRYDSENSLS